jgi:cytochrome c553
MPETKTAVEWLFNQIKKDIIGIEYDYADELKQAKEMEKEQQGYSEEDMIEFAEFVATYPDKNKNVNGQILHAKSKYDGAERTIDLLEQFKKK